MKMLYVRMSRTEKSLGWAWLAVSLLLRFLLPAGVWTDFLRRALDFAAALLIFRSFLQKSAQVPLLRFTQLLGYSFLALILAQLANLLTNDLLYYFFPQYFRYSLTGPYFYNVEKAAMQALLQENYPLTALSVILFAPLAEELFYRGLVFGSLYDKNPTLAYLVSLVLYSLVLSISLTGHYPASYVVISFLQYLPISLFFSWFYAKSDTILTPILAHIVMNAVSVLTML